MARTYRRMKSLSPDVWDGLLKQYSKLKATTQDTAAHVIAENVILFLSSGAVKKALSMEVNRYDL